MKAMVLAAGLGTRLRPITYDLPKPLAPVLDRPVMEHALTLLRHHGLLDVVANVHYFPDLIEDYFGDGSKWGLDLRLSFERELLGTAGGVRNVRDYLGDGPFLIISGDGLTDIDLTALIARHKQASGIATLALTEVDDTREYGVALLDDEGRITGFQEKPQPREARSNLANCGIYVFEPQIFDYFPKGDFVDWAKDVFPTLLGQGVPFYGHEFDGYWNDVGSLEEYRRGNLDALKGVVSVEIDVPQVGEGIYAADGCDLSAVEVEAPVFIGRGCTLGKGVRLSGPVVLGGGSKVGDGAALRDVIATPRSQFAPNSLTINAMVGHRGAFSP